MLRACTVIVVSILLPFPAQAILPVSPIMASFSNELDFDALRGEIQHFEQTLYDQNQLPLMVASGEFDSQGCLTRYQRTDNVTQKQLTLVRDDSHKRLISQQSPQRQIVLTDDCRIAATTGSDDINREYIYRDNLLVKVKDARDGYVYKEYFYTPQAMPRIVVWYNDDSDVLMLTEPKKRLSDPWDFVTQGYDNGHPVYRAFKKCQYDNHANPTGCALIIDNQGENAGQTVQEIRYRITYYR